MADLGRMSQLMNVLTGIKRMKEEEDPLKRMQAVATLESTALDIAGKRRALAGPSPREKYNEEQRTQQVGSALEMFADLYKTASPASKNLLGEQMGSLWGMMNKADKTKYKMLVSHTPLNPAVQKSIWFEETNPRPQMPIIKEGDGSWTNIPPRTPEYRRVWAEFDVASDEWNTLRKMAVEGKDAKEMNWKTLPKQYQTEDPKITAYRDPLDKRVKYFNWNIADQAEIGTAIEQGWATQSDMMNTGIIPLAAPKEYSLNNRPVTVTQGRDAVSGDVKLNYKAAGPVDESGMKAPKALTDAVGLIDSGILPSALKEQDSAVVSYYVQLDNIIKASGQERTGLQLQLQQSVAGKYPPNERYIPFVPPPARQKDFFYKLQQVLDWVPGLAFFIPTPSPGKQGNVVLMQADRLVDFYDKNGKGNKFWWSDVFKVAYDIDGMPIQATLNKVPGDTLDIDWSK